MITDFIFSVLFWFSSVVKLGSDKPFRGMELLISQLTRLRLYCRHERKTQIDTFRLYYLTTQKHLVEVQGPYSQNSRILVLRQVGYEAHSDLCPMGRVAFLPLPLPLAAASRENENISSIRRCLN